MNKQTKKATSYSALFYKELCMAVLAAMSVLSVIYEYLAAPDYDVRIHLHMFDLFVAVVFLTDFCVMWYGASDRKKYLRRNWYLLLASIPILESWAELLRGLRLLELVRLIRAGEHLNYAYNAAKHDAKRDRSRQHPQHQQR